MANSAKFGDLAFLLKIAELEAQTAQQSSKAKAQ